MRNIDVTRLPHVDFNNRKGLPKASGVYLAWATDRLLYVGASANIKTRWTGHHRILDFIENGCTRISWLLVDRENLSILEGDLRETLKPLFNSFTLIGKTTTVSKPLPPPKETGLSRELRKLRVGGDCFFPGFHNNGKFYTTAARLGITIVVRSEDGGYRIWRTQ